jgi:uncharacterized protein
MLSRSCSSRHHAGFFRLTDVGRRLEPPPSVKPVLHSVTPGGMLRAGASGDRGLDRLTQHHAAGRSPAPRRAGALRVRRWREARAASELIRGLLDTGGKPRAGALRRRFGLACHGFRLDGGWWARETRPFAIAFPVEGDSLQTDPSGSPSAHAGGGLVVGLWRYPVKSMMGEELNAAEVTERGLVGDRRFAVVDASTGKVAGAKNPKRWGNFFDFQAAYVEPPKGGSELPAVRVTLPDGSVVTSDQPDVAQVLSEALGRDVTFAEARGDGESSGAQAEEYWPDIDGLDYRDIVTDFELPAGTFFDLAVMHVLSTATIDHLRELYPEGRFEVRRFRPNIVVSTGSDQHGFVENDWIGRTVSVGDEVRLRIAGPCPRCVMTTLPQGDLPKDAGILRAAAQHNHANVGVYADVIAGGTTRRGDPIALV